MTIKLNPYISFRGQAREAIEFYHSVFGGELTINTFADLHAAQDPSENDLIMHSALVVDDSLQLMASDTRESMPYNPGDNISISLAGEDADSATLHGYWGKLIAGGTVTQELSKAVWGDEFGMVVDKFGITWLVNIAAPAA